MNVKEALQKARDLITDPDAWTQGQFARDSAGKGTLSYLTSEGHEKDVCWCAWGALQAVTGGRVIPHSPLYDALVAETGGCNSIALFNDESTHEEVLAAFDSAIEKCEP